MSFARACPQLARLCMSQLLETLDRSCLEYGRMAEEAKHAKECLRLMERKWEVVDMNKDAGKGQVW